MTAARSAGRLPSLSLVVLLAACGSGAAATPQPTLPPRPAVPDLWRTVTSDDSAVRLVVPTDLTVTGTSDQVAGFRSAADGPDDLVIVAVGPRHLQQPAAGESVAEWLERDGWLTNHQEGDRLREVSQVALLLPAGPAVEMISSFGSGDMQYWSIVYAIRTPAGYGLLQAAGAGPRPNAAPDEIRLMRELVEFAP